MSEADKRKSETGRRPKLTRERIEEICAYLARGLSKRSAVNAALVSETAFYGWLKQGEKDLENGKLKTLQAELVQSVKKAEAEFKLKHTKNIETAASDGSWQASAWLLERRYREEYGKSAVDVNLAGRPGGEPVKTESAVQIYLPSNGREERKGGDA